MFLLLPLLFVLLLPSLSPCASHEDEYRKIQEKMAEQKKKLGEVQKRETSVLNDLDIINMNIEKIRSDLARYRKSLARTEAEVAETEAEIAKTKAVLDKEKEWLRRKLRAMNRVGYSPDAIALLLGADDVSQLMRAWKYLESVTLYEHRVLENYRENLRRLDEKSARLQSLRSVLSSDTQKVKSKETELDQTRTLKETVLSSVRSEKAARQKMIEELKAASRRLEELIRQSSRTKTDDYAATGFSKLKGRLLWPAEGRIALPYGSQRDPQFDTPVFRNGVHIQTSPESDARSVYGGKVIFAEWFKGFGELVIVNHGSGYHTLYGNLSEIFSHAGDIIKENQVIGKVGTSGILNAPGLYFEIRYKGKPLDPMQWLRRDRRR